MANYTVKQALSTDVTASLQELKDLFQVGKTPTVGYSYTTIDDNGVVGKWKYDSTDTTSTNDDVLVLVSAGGHRFKRVIVNNTVYLDWFTGISDYSIVLNKLWTAGYHVEGKLGATYTCTSILTLTDKGCSFDGNNCNINFTLSGTASTAWLTVKTTPGTAYTVESIADWQNSSTSTSNDLWTNIGLGGSHGSSYAVISGDVTSVFSPGTCFKLYSYDDFVSGFVDIQKGEFLTVETCAYDATSGKTRVAWQGGSLYSYTVNASNTKMCVVTNPPVYLRNFTITQTQTKILGAFDLTGLIDAKVENVTFKNFYHAIIELRSTYNCSIKGCTFVNSQNDPPEGYGPSGSNAGYAIGVSHDAGTNVDDCRFINVRHGVTTGSWYNNASSSANTYPYYMGETTSLNVSNNKSFGCAQSFDTHAWGTNITFTNNHAVACSGVYQIRSRNTKILGGSITRCLTGVYINITTSGIQDDPVIVENLSVFHTHQDGSNCIKVTNTVAFPVLLKGLYVRGGYFDLSGSGIVVENCTIDTTRQTVGTEVDKTIMCAGGSKVTLINNRFITSNGSYKAVWFTGTGADVVIKGLTIESLSDTTPDLANGNTGTSVLFAAYDVLYLGDGPSNATTTFPATNLTSFASLRAQWRTEWRASGSTNKNSSYWNMTGSGTINIDNIIKYVADENVFIKCNISAAATVSSFPAQGNLAGQRITIQNITANTLTLPTLTNGSKSLTQWQSATIWWTSSEWLYL